MKYKSKGKEIAETGVKKNLKGGLNHLNFVKKKTGSYKDRSAGTKGGGQFPGRVQGRGQKLTFSTHDDKKPETRFLSTKLDTRSPKKCSEFFQPWKLAN